MVLSSSERDDLIRRVEQKLGRTPVRAQLVREVVDRTLGALPDLAAAAPRASAAPAERRAASASAIRMVFIP